MATRCRTARQFSKARNRPLTCQTVGLSSPLPKALDGPWRQQCQAARLHQMVTHFLGSRFRQPDNRAPHRLWDQVGRRLSITSRSRTAMVEANNSIHGPSAIGAIAFVLADGHRAASNASV